MLMLALLTACQERRTFDDRYNATTNEIEQRAGTLDKQASGPAGSANR
ncbi:MAG: hypothetical protein ABIQ32_05015 [Sphingomicrobium sp.]